MNNGINWPEGRRSHLAVRRRPLRNKIYTFVILVVAVENRLYENQEYNHENRATRLKDVERNLLIKW